MLGISKERQLIYLEDIAVIYDDVKERTSFSRYNGKDNISISIQKQALGNTVKIVEKVKNKIAEMRLDIPKDINIDIVYDQSKFIKSSITGVWDAAWQGAVLVMIVLYYFLRNIWSALIVTFTIPISILATFALMYLFNISINMMSLGGLAFGVGALVDAGIVVIENIFTHIQQGKDKKEAAIIGAEEVAVAVAGSVLTTVVVFLPFVFVIGITGQILKDFSLTVTFSLMTSWLVAVTIIPFLATRGVKISEDDPKMVKKLRNFYSNLTTKFTEKPARHLTYTVIILLLSLGLFAVMDKEFMPKVDQGEFIIKIDMPAGTRLQVTNDVSTKAESIIRSIPEVESVNVTVGSTKESTMKSIAERLSSSQSEIVVGLKSKRKRKSSDVVQEIKNRLSAIELEGARIEYTLQENVFGSGLGTQAAVTLELRGTELAKLESLTKEIQEKLGKIEGIYGVKNNLGEPSPETKIFVNKDKASLYGLSVTDIAQTALIGLKGYVASKYKDRGEEFDIRIRLREKDRDTFEKLSRIEVHSPTGSKVTLGSVATFGKGKGPSEIRRMNQERVVLIYANTYGRSSKDVMADVDRLIAATTMPKGYYVKLAGATEEMKSSFESMRNAIIAAFLLV